MEIRVLKYFLAVVEAESISAAAKAMHITQPTLSKQIRDLEDELGKQLIIRGSKKISLTDEGRLFHKRAQEIVDLVSKTQSEIRSEHVGGDIYIGCGETEGMRLIAKAIKSLRQDYPLIHVHLFSGNVTDVMERLDKSLLDFGVLISPPSLSGYDSVQLPFSDTCGLLMRKDSLLANRDTIRPDDLTDLPLIISRNENSRRAMSKWAGQNIEALNIVATFNLILNAALLVEEGVGYAYCLDKLIHISEGHNLCFKPFEPKFEVDMSLVWKKHQTFSGASTKFLERLTRFIDNPMENNQLK